MNLYHGDEIAIIGMSGRFPQARDVDEFWEKLKGGVECITFFTEEELRGYGVHPQELLHPQYVKAMGCIDDVELFDAAFFNMTPREAQISDPQHRLFLLCAWEALESAGYALSAQTFRTGVYAGTGISTYLLHSYADIVRMASEPQIVLANDKDYLSTRVSYKLNLTGPSLTVQTACSTSLSAIHLACQGLLNGECEMALAGGVSIAVPSRRGYIFEEGSIFSPDGHCRTFDAAAAGTLIGNGVGVVVLKRLADARDAGDTISAIIKGSAMNNDGSQKIGYTAPSIQGQAAVIREALAVARIDPATVTYVEAHGTGTRLGDPIEVEALSSVYGVHAERKNSCAIGSVKPNIGHLDSAAGVAGVIKTTLALRHRQIPPNINYQRPNPAIDFANSPFYVSTTLADWSAGPGPRRAGVSGFGMGGTNVHLLLEEAPEEEQRGDEGTRPYYLVPLSAKTSTALERMSSNLAAHLRAHPELNLADLAHTLQSGRQLFSHRRLVICRRISDLRSSLEDSTSRHSLTGVEERSDRAVAFLFSGQGAQYPAMGQELYQHEPAFRAEIDRCATILTPMMGFDPRRVLYPELYPGSEAVLDLNQTWLAQPLLFMVEYALAQLFNSWGIRPRAMIGHSLGEYVAACLAGVFSLDVALELVSLRGRMMQELPGGAMLSISLSERELLPHLNDQLALAAVNTHDRCVASGPAQAIAALEEQLAAQGVECRRLHTSHAFHSAMMDPMIAAFNEHLSTLVLQPPQLPFISNLTGSWITAEQATSPAYWCQHLRQTVRFADALRTLAESGELILLEIGPGQTLSTFATRFNKSHWPAILSSLRHPQESQPDLLKISSTLGQLWLRGARMRWSELYQDRPRRIPLPTYPFELQPYWITPTAAAEVPGSIQLHKRADLGSWFYLPSWERDQPVRQTALEEHPREPQTYLIFADAYGVGAALGHRLRQMNHQVITVMAGEGFISSAAPLSYTIDPAQADDYVRLFAALDAAGTIPTSLLHMWSLTPDSEPVASAGALERLKTLGFTSLVLLAQTIGRQKYTLTANLEVISSQLHRVIGSERLSPIKALMIGPCRVIGEEYPQITCRSIDIVYPGAPALDEQLLGQLLHELGMQPTARVIAYRGNYRWVEAFSPIRLEPQPAPLAHSPRLRPRGTYLITGGLGGFGLVFAHYLARTVQAQLVLMGRSPFLAEELWDDWVDRNGEDDATSRKIAQIRTFQDLGAEVLIISADVASRDELERGLAQARARFGPIHGVIQAAGIASGGFIDLKTPAQLDAVLAPKVNGTLLLEELLAPDAPDFMLLCSSLNAFLGGVGRIDYCAANAFLDAFAQDSEARAFPTIAINWDAWQEVGMSVATDIPSDLQQRLEQHLQNAIAVAEGPEVLERILNSGLHHVAVSTQDLHAVIERTRSQTLKQYLHEAEEQSQPAHPRPALKNDYAAPRNSTEQQLAEIWQGLLGIDQVGIHDNFFELGGDSLIGARVIARAKQHELLLTPKQLFESQTIADLAPLVAAIQTPTSSAQVVQGRVPLTTGQAWFFDQDQLDPGRRRWNIAMLIELPQALDRHLLAQTLSYLFAYHEALRAYFVIEAGHVTQYLREPSDSVPLVYFDFSQLAPEALHRAIEEQSQQLQNSLDIFAGRTIQFAYFDCGAEHSDRLLFITHHVLMDFHSVSILLNDLQTTYAQMQGGQHPQLPVKNTTLKAWCERLATYAQAKELYREAQSYWLALPWEQVPNLPMDYPERRQENTIRSRRSIQRALSYEETHTLLQRLSELNNAQMLDALMLALVRTITRWTGGDWLELLVVNSGRDLIPDAVDLDLSQTVGWFATSSTLLLKRPAAQEAASALGELTAQLRSIPNKGFGYQVLRFLGHDPQVVQRLAELRKEEIILNYLGQIDAESQASAFRIAPESVGATENPEDSHAVLLACMPVIVGGTLIVEWVYSEHIYQSSTIEALAEGFMQQLCALLK